MKEKINSYIAILLIVVAATGATMIIVHVVTASTFTFIVGNSESDYAPLQQSILKP